MTHREMHRITDVDEKKEICDSKTLLESIIHTPVETFVYPVGKIGKHSEKYLEECGYSLAWSTGFGEMLNWDTFKPYRLNRVRIHHDTGAGMYTRRATHHP